MFMKKTERMIVVLEHELGSLASQQIYSDIKLAMIGMICRFSLLVFMIKNLARFSYGHLQSSSLFMESMKTQIKCREWQLVFDSAPR